jgi:hypothetical protein
MLGGTHCFLLRSSHHIIRRHIPEDRNLSLEVIYINRIVLGSNKVASKYFLLEVRRNQVPSGKSLQFGGNYMNQLL